VINANTFNGDAALTINFNSSDSYDPDGRITQWRWNLGDGKRASTENVNHTFSNPGTYTITLRVRDNNGKWSSTARRQVVVTSKS
jgi:surface-anchored protein